MKQILFAVMLLKFAHRKKQAAYKKENFSSNAFLSHRRFLVKMFGS